MRFREGQFDSSVTRP
nr:unnamed protein product [Callosobruchus chinensis]